MIQKARFQNFKSLRDVTVEFDSRLTVLVGPNGSGKTSVLQGLHLVTTSRGNGRERLHECRAIGTARAHCSVEGVDSYGHHYSVMLESDKLTPAVHGQPPATTDVLHFVPKQLSTPTLLESNQLPPRIGSSGEGLSSTLNYIKNFDELQFSEIVRSFCRIIPQARGIRFDLAATSQKYAAPRLLVDFERVRGVRADHLSSGTLIVLGLLTVAMGPDSPEIVLVDELDNALHPKAQAELIGVFQRLVEVNPRLQVIATSHSVYILHHLRAEQVRLMNIGPDGSATCGRLESHPDYERWKDHMTPGEFWTHVGEDWLIKKPAPEVAA